MIVDTTILIPQDPSIDDAFCRAFATPDRNLLRRVILLRCRRENPSVVWQGLSSSLMEAPKTTGKICLKAMFELLGLPLLLPARKSNATKFALSTKDDPQLTGEDELWKKRVTKRRLRLDVEPGTNRANDAPRRQQLLIWIQPPSSTYYTTFFTGIMIKFENQMILYQSLAAWFSTLGGGHFFCRHLSTAVALAKLQRRVALVMGDYIMAYKCTINEAYSYIYAGKFDMALKTLKSVVALNRRVDNIHPLDDVIVNMCKSAKLFCKRVRNASKKLDSVKTQQEAMTFDDYQRIRVIQ